PLQNGTGWKAGSGVAGLGQQSKREVLPAHSNRQETTRAGKGTLESRDDAYRKRPGGCMILFHRLKSFARWLFRRVEVERQLHDELESFIELTARDRIRDGVAPDEARRLARLELRGVDQTKERVRWYRWGAQLDVLLQDLRYGWRSLTNQPGFTAIIVVTLAVGD